MAKWVAPLVVGGLIGAAASAESRTMRRAGFKATKDRVSKCISGKVRGEGWDQQQAVAACLSMQEQRRLRPDGSYIRKGQRAKHSKRDFVKQVWERQAPTMAGGPLPPPIPGMEGPFRYRSGRVLYWDPKEGAYYDRGRDMYVTVEEVEFAMRGERQRRHFRRRGMGLRARRSSLWWIR